MNVETIVYQMHQINVYELQKMCVTGIYFVYDILYTTRMFNN